MHYIRFLKTPRLSASSLSSLNAKVTITTDLGESFLMTDIQLTAELEMNGNTILGTSNEYTWKGSNGMRALEVQIPIPTRRGAKFDGLVKMVVKPKDHAYIMNTFEDVLASGGEDGGGVVTLRSMGFKLSLKESTAMSMAERVFVTQQPSSTTTIRIYEETGESIARHICRLFLPGDAGLVLSAYLSSLRGPNPHSTSNRTIHLPVLESLLGGNENDSINALELGAGCGIVGITLGTAFRDVTRKILLTDLSEASEILEHNLALSTLSTSKISHKVLDWSEPLPDFVQKELWNLVLVADCTYNPDVVPDLVATLKRVKVGNEGVLILLAMKVRHDSEMVFFEFMANEGFMVVEKGKVPVGVIGAEEEEIEIYVFR
ncbi:upf0665 family c protein [Rutstroemia sp. NJR-2017a WRK4]|nr:upf0665 family c protein [Rutstroemia sp. NJR-2017a WRK4]